MRLGVSDHPILVVWAVPLLPVAFPAAGSLCTGLGARE
jgi:hypothetical protein